MFHLVCCQESGPIHRAKLLIFLRETTRNTAKRYRERERERERGERERERERGKHKPQEAYEKKH